MGRVASGDEVGLAVDLEGVDDGQQHEYGDGRREKRKGYAGEPLPTRGAIEARGPFKPLGNRREGGEPEHRRVAEVLPEILDDQNAEGCWTAEPIDRIDTDRSKGAVDPSLRAEGEGDEQGDGAHRKGYGQQQDRLYQRCYGRGSAKEQRAAEREGQECGNTYGHEGRGISSGEAEGFAGENRRVVPETDEAIADIVGEGATGRFEKWCSEEERRPRDAGKQERNDDEWRFAEAGNHGYCFR